MASKPEKRALSNEDQIFRSLRVGATFSRKNVPPALQTRKAVPAAVISEASAKRESGHKDEEKRSKKKRKLEKAEKAKKHKHDHADVDEEDQPEGDEDGTNEAADGDQDQVSREEDNEEGVEAEVEEGGSEDAVAASQPVSVRAQRRALRLKVDPADAPAPLADWSALEERYIMRSAHRRFLPSHAAAVISSRVTSRSTCKRLGSRLPRRSKHRLFHAF
jgi:flagellar biosynthesis GTPase FlhF